jgi:hypothetical protein
LPPVDSAVETEEPEALSDDLSAFWEGADFPSTPTESPDLTLDAFDLLADLPAIAPPPATAREPMPATSTVQPLENQPTELDTQSLTIDDAFVDFLEAAHQPAVDSSDRNIVPPDSSNLQSDEKKKTE